MKRENQDVFRNDGNKKNQLPLRWVDKRSALLWFNLFMGGALLSLFLLYHLYTHNLDNSGNWKSTKTTLEKGVMGSWAFMYTYRALVDNRLDLSTWHGYQEVFLQRDMDFFQSGFRTKLSDSAALVIYYGIKGDTLLAFRISPNKQYASASLGVFEGMFVIRRPLEVEVPTDQWIDVQVRYTEKGVRISLDGEEHLLPGTLTGSSKPTLGFRGYDREVFIDDIYLLDATGELIFQDDFSWKPRHIGAFLLIFLVVNLLFILIRRLRKVALVVAVNSLIIIGLCLVFFAFYGKYRYPAEWMIDWRSAVTTIDTGEEVLQSMEDCNVSEADSAVLKILFLGSSQTWGAGATNENQTFVSLFEKSARQEMPFAVKCINAGISDTRSDVLLDHYRTHWIGLNPDVCVVNLSLNDCGNPSFEENLERIVALNDSLGIVTVMIPEPIIQDVITHKMNQNMVRSVAHSHHLTIIEMQSLLDDKIDDGFLYWDVVHLTDFGHRLFADKLSSDLIPILKKEF